MLGRRRHGGGELGLLLLFLELARVGIDYIPPVTLGVIAVNVLFHLFIPLNIDIMNACVSAVHVIHHLQLHRLVLSAVYHWSDIHLYYNMSSFLYKGRKLEPILGSWPFASMIVVFGVGTSVLMVGASYVLYHFLNYADSYYTCAAGFSGVLFGLKVVLYKLNPYGHGYILGFIPVEVRYLAWAELLVIHLLVPNASFLGHLCGLLMGYAYIQGYLNPIFGMLNSGRTFFQPATGNRAYFDSSNYNGPNNNTNNNTNSNNNDNNNNDNNNNGNNNTNITTDIDNDAGFRNRYNRNYNNNTNRNSNRNNNSNASSNTTNSNNNTNENNSQNNNNNENNANNENNNSAEYSNLGTGFYNRYRNYNYNSSAQSRPTKRSASNVNSAHRDAVVDGWRER